ncbi:GNAT family N-acetyltransferase [Nitrincola schmidtii]|uniref:GNAT family N-acetyltransferase n=1 Tax=Nitrincola schmidtii TaxID=1730894 RepID=UPI00124E8CCE|nr:N-acetyltransferase [Nitrincola schmidtii]
MNIELSNEKSGDAARIHQVTKQAFFSAPHTDHMEQYIVDALRRAGALKIFQVAKAEGEIIGHVAISPVILSGGVTGWFGLGPISVLPEFQGLGIGTKLMQNSLAALEEMNALGCVVLGNPTYYERFGLKVVDGLVLPDVPAEYFQALSFSGEFPKGEVSYHDAFTAKS